jgi:putative hydrolase of the HAD superfamily
MDVDWVFFDAGNTLIYAEPPVGEAYAQALRRRGVPADASEVGEGFVRALAELRSQHRGDALPYGNTRAQARRWWRRVVALTFEPYAAAARLDDIFEELWDHFASPSSWRVYDDAVPALEALRQMGLRLGVISNWDERLVGLLEQLGLRGLLDTCTVSFQVGAEKPDAAIFQRVLATCRVTAERAVHVGDSYEDDVLGARRAGLHALLLWRSAQSPPQAQQGDCIRSLAELPGLLRRKAEQAGPGTTRGGL